MDDKKVLHLPEENISKILIGVSSTTNERINRISEKKNLTKTALVSLAVELFDNMSDDVSIVIK